MALLRNAVRILLASSFIVCRMTANAVRCPSLETMWPTRGPAAGGTRITIRGHHLDTVISWTLLPAGLTQAVDSKDAHELFVTSPGYSGNQRLPAVMSVHLQTSSFHCSDVIVADTFTYLSNPSHVRSSRNPMHTILAGGINQTIVGRNLDSVAAPKLVVTTFYKNTSVDTQTSSCTVVNSTEAICQTPDLTESVSAALRRDSSLRSTIDYGLLLNELNFSFNVSLQLDAVSAWLTSGDLSLLVFQRPYLDLQSPFVVTPNSTVTITGRSLTNHGFSSDDVTVYVDNYACNDVTVTDSAITCRLPPINGSLAEHARVIVQIGEWYRVELNTTWTETSDDGPSSLTITLVIVAACVLVLVIVLANLAAFYHGVQCPAATMAFNPYEDFDDFDDDDESESSRQEEKPQTDPGKLEQLADRLRQHFHKDKDEDLENIVSSDYEEYEETAEDAFQYEVLQQPC